MSDIQIFQLLALYYVAVGVGMLINQELYKKLFTEILDFSIMWLFGGILALVVGYLLVTFHNVWVMDWTVIITVIGWIALIKGLTILIRPNWMIDLTKAFFNIKNIMKIEGIVVTVIGLLFAFLGFCPKSPLANIL